MLLILKLLEKLLDVSIHYSSFVSSYEAFRGRLDYIDYIVDHDERQSQEVSLIQSYFIWKENCIIKKRESERKI
jgi:hypothetical protein